MHTTLQFFGGAREVTGSCYLLEHAGQRVLLDCGMRQGESSAEKSNRNPFPFDAASIDAVVLSHAHLDHSGRLPHLVKAGFTGRIHLTPASLALLELMLLDAAFLEGREVEWENRRRQRANAPLLEPAFTQEDVARTLEHCRALRYETAVEVVSGVSIRLLDAGHILGSAIVNVDIDATPKAKRLVFSGDLGNSHGALLRDPTPVHHADVVLLESTYGDRCHRNTQETLEEFAEILSAANEEGGNVLIPAFAVGRTQELIYRLGEFEHRGALPQTHVFLDSPMAIGASEIYARHRHLFNETDAQQLGGADELKWSQWLPKLRLTSSTQESMAINRLEGGAVVIAGSGMCTGGRIRHHLKHNLWRRQCHVVISGFQARGTLGRALVDGAKRVRLFGEDIAVNAAVHTLGGFSAHADQQQLLDWLSQLEQPPAGGLYLVHGELEKIMPLQEQVFDQLGWFAKVPRLNERVQL